jgi:hypothetical protein
MLPLLIFQMHAMRRFMARECLRTKNSILDNARERVRCAAKQRANFSQNATVNIIVFSFISCFCQAQEAVRQKRSKNLKGYNENLNLLNAYNGQ